MRILHYHRDMRLETGGVVRAVLDLCGGLAERGHDVTLLTLDPTDVPADWMNGAPGGPRAATLPRPLFADGPLSRAGRRAFDRHLEDADVLHLHSMWTVSNIQCSAAARRRAVPYVYSVHGMLDDWCMAQRGPKKRLYLSLFGRRMLEGAHAVHCTAQAELDQARKWFPGGRGVVIPLVFDLAPFEDLPGPEPARRAFPVIDSARPLVLFMSRLHYKKGVELLVRAAALLRDGGHDFHVAIAGTGEADYEQQLRALSTELGLDDHVTFTGFVSGVEKISLYEAATVFVLPTSQENFGFVLFEALAAGTPVVTTRGADTWPEMEASGGAVIVDADPTAIADAVASILESADRRAQMSHDGRAWVFANLGGETVVQRFEALYGEATGGR